MKKLLLPSKVIFFLIFVSCTQENKEIKKNNTISKTCINKSNDSNRIIENTTNAIETVKDTAFTNIENFDKKSISLEKNNTKKDNNITQKKSIIKYPFLVRIKKKDNSVISFKYDYSKNSIAKSTSFPRGVKKENYLNEICFVKIPDTVNVKLKDEINSFIDSIRIIYKDYNIIE